jgi:IstB-like ATP binding protein
MHNHSHLGRLVSRTISVLLMIEGNCSCRRAKPARFVGHLPVGLVNDLLAAKEGLRLSKFIKPITKLDLVVLDELGFIPFSKDGGQVLFQLCSDLNERVSIMITTNVRFADWNGNFGESNTTRYPTL